jgi:hypothetical protein
MQKWEQVKEIKGEDKMFIELETKRNTGMLQKGS